MMKKGPAKMEKGLKQAEKIAVREEKGKGVNLGSMSDGNAMAKKPGISMMRDDANRTYVGEFTIISANTCEKKTITIPCDTNGKACANDIVRGFIFLLYFQKIVRFDHENF